MAVAADGNDEIGRLGRAFERMRQAVQQRDVELRRFNDSLQIRVEERTRELAKALEAAQAASRAKGEFLANMSHELRTPLNAILGFNDLLQQGADEGATSQRDEWCDIIRSSGRHLLALINDVLDLSKVDAGRLEVEELDCAAHQILADATSVLRPRALEKGLQLHQRYGSRIPETVRTDPTRLHQVLVNLIGNAIKFTDQGHVEVVASFRTEGDSGRMRFDVRDTGIGLTAEQIGRVFDPFAQGDSTVTRKYGGTGLGLAISKRIATALGGLLTVQSEPGTGSVFTFEIDTGPVTGVSMIERPIGEALAGPRQHAVPNDQQCVQLNHRVLVVDDGDTNRKLIRLVLSRAGAEVVEAENGRQAVDMASVEQFNLILMDMQMPVMDGYSATAELRRREVGCPVIALTAHAMKGDDQKCLDAGCTGYLAKPFDPGDLVATVAAALGCDGEASAPPAPETGTPTDVGEPSTPLEPIVSTLPLDDHEFCEIVVEFIDRLQSQLEQMTHAQRAADYDELAKLAHWLKGSGGTAGYERLTSVAAELGQLAKQRQVERIATQLQDLRDVVARVVAGGPNVTTGSQSCRD